MDVLQVWMLIGIPALALAGALWLRHSPWRAALGYGVMLAGFFGMAYYDRVSAAVFGGLIALVYAAGRGGSIESQDDHQDEYGVPNEALLPSRRVAGR